MLVTNSALGFREGALRNCSIYVVGTWGVFRDKVIRKLTNLPGQTVPSNAAGAFVTHRRQLRQKPSNRLFSCKFGVRHLDHEFTSFRQIHSRSARQKSQANFSCGEATDVNES
jgi:hypothetical protein